jgi:serine protein kinase
MSTVKSSLIDHISEVQTGKRVFENVYQSISRMILGEDHFIEKIKVNGRNTYDFKVFRQQGKHIIGMYDELNSFVAYVKDAAEGGSSAEMAYVLIGEPGNGKTFFVEYLCRLYRDFLERQENRKYTFRFQGLDKLDGYGSIKRIESQTYEDPMVLAMNLFPAIQESREFMSKQGYKDEQVDHLFKSYRPLGACSDYILNDIREYCDGDLEKMLEFIQVVQVPMSETLGTITGKYPAKDKITSSAVDLLGEESIQRLLHISDSNNPYRFDLRRGALARVAGGGIHFADEIFKNKKDLVQIYLGVIQNRTIELDGFKWPIDTLIIATSNNAEFNKFLAEREEAPIVDRCRLCYVSHNTDYKLQESLTEYALGSHDKTTFANNKLHIDPNFNYAASVAVTLSRLPRSEKLTPVETLKLAAGEVAGEKSIKMLREIIDDLQSETDITKRFGQKGLGQRNLGRAIQLVLERSETNEGNCMFARDVFLALRTIILDYIQDPNDRAKYLEDLQIAQTLYKEKIKVEIFDAYMDEPKAIEKNVMNYVNMIVGIDAEHLGSDRMWKYPDPQTGELTAIKIDERYINSVEEIMGLNTKEQKESFRTTIRKLYGQKIATEKNYNFMDNLELVKAVTDVRLNADIGTAGSLVGALANRTDEENQKLYTRLMSTMKEKLGYCVTCAEKTLEYYTTLEDES